ncbi:hypothetical protein BEWA_001820 [Theileria equi strain WA]|uniref:Uncharacterized protein n=1 Tax=Theileria equi strain WA TaxID=1537102 RepID=L0AYY3_THEEQ|nr:hypothetical protein BEWA_001820 [Theileria equi strain WA]AFZ80775.1 hypothetical protein BEWA_001820 [Theileria equi strain WA]|eukprot:XP_004830441.1 hypothetical protein BEWA_001820 [Theileria equi strain WA]
MSGVLTLNLRCSGDKGQCTCGSDITDLKVKKETNIGGVTNFIKYTHHLEGHTFKLNITLKDGDQIRGGFTARRGQPIKDVEEVSVYYWSGKPDKPILLGITTTSGDRQPKYYSRGDGSGLSWMNAPVADKNLNEQEALDDQNCRRNQAVPFNIISSQFGSLLKESKSNCLNNYRRIEPTRPPPPSPPGSNYSVTTYNITGPAEDTKISRVTLRGDSVNITFRKHDAIEKIRLYSYQGSGDVPLMLEFKPKNGGGSTFYESTSQDGNNWIEVGDGKSKNFYSGDKGNTKPTDVLSEKLDEVLCKQYNNVTLDISYGKHNGGNSQHCCSDHKDGISVTSGDIKVNDDTKTSYYKYSLPQGRPNLAGIKYYNNSDRKNIKIGGLPFSGSNPINVYAFSCTGEIPVLIYVDSKSAISRGWYKKEDNSDNWKWISELIGIKPTDFKDLTCVKWRKLRKHLTGPSCNGLSDCSYNGNTQKEAEDEEQLKQEEKREQEKRNEEIKKQTLPLPHGAPVPGPSLGTADSSSSGSTSGVRSRSSGDTDSHLPKHQTQLQIVAQSDPQKVTIELKHKPPNDGSVKTYTGASTGGRTITVTRTPDPTPDFCKYTHIQNGGLPFELKEIQREDDSKIDIFGLNLRSVSSVSAYYWTGKTERNPLLIDISYSDGKFKYYANSKGNKWNVTQEYIKTEASGKLSDSQLLKELTLLNCEINDVIQIDVTRIPNSDHTETIYCHYGHDDSYSKKIKVEEVSDSGRFGNYTAFVHTPNPSIRTFNISAFTKNGTPITLSGLRLPVRDANKVVVYFCRREVDTGTSARNPLLIYLPNSDQGEHWFKKPEDSSNEWKPASSLKNSYESDYTKIIEILDGLESACKPPEVTINIYNRLTGGTRHYNETSWVDVEDSLNSNINGFTEYTHKAYGIKGSYFTVNKFQCGEKDIECGLERTEKVTSVSVFYWTALETEKRGRPLLVKVVIKNPTGGIVNEMYYENMGVGSDDNTQWQLWIPPGYPKNALKDKLTLLNCDLNHVVNIDISRTRGNYCGHRHHNANKKGTVKEVCEKNLGRYKAFEHKPNEKAYTVNSNPKAFHISEFTSGKDITLNGLPTPILDAKKVVVYFCGKIPLLVYIYSNDLMTGPEKWFQSEDGGGTWRSASTLNGNNGANNDAIVGLLDTLNSPCKPSSITIDIYKRSSSGATYHQYTDTSSRRVITVTGVRNSSPGFIEYRHAILGRTTFTIEKFQYNEKPVTGGLSVPMSKVEEVSVYYWFPLETMEYMDKSRPLLFKVTLHGGDEKWYENNAEWKSAEGSGIFSPDNFQKKLQMLNCKLNYAVIIDVGKATTTEYDACDDDMSLDRFHSNDKMKVEKDDTLGSELGKFVVYTHKLKDNNSSGTKFHIVSFKNGSHIMNLNGVVTPVLDVDVVKVYFCSKERDKPLLIYYHISNGGSPEHHWHQNNGDTTTGKWEPAENGLSDNTDPDSPENHRKILNVINGLPTKCKQSTPPTALTSDSPPSPPPSAELPPEASPFVETAATATGLGVIFGSSSGTLAGTGSLTGLGWWMFKRSKGDPWVRQI